MRDISYDAGNTLSNDGAQILATVRYPAGRVTFAAFLMIFLGALFCLVAFDPMLVADLAQRESRGGRYGYNPFPVFELFTLFGVNVPCLLLAVFFFYGGQKLVRRSINTTAILIDDLRTQFQSTIRHQPIQSSSIEEMRYLERRGAASLQIVSGNEVIKVHGVLKDDATTLVEAFERWRQGTREP